MSSFRVGIAAAATLGIVAALFLWVLKPTPPPSMPLPSASFGGVSLTIEYATTSEARARGLSYRPQVPEGYGMLFVFPHDGLYGFWMKETLVSLDIFWLDSQGHVITIAKNISPATFPHVFYPTQPARYVLETRAGFADLYAIATGTPLLLPNWPSVSE